MPGQQRDTGRPVPWESGLVIVDKPGGMTSHDVVARIRRLAHTRRVGHAGTLDPMATGVLVIGIEKATRLLGHLMLTEKTYEATIRLGQSTSTDDAEGQPTGTALRRVSARVPDTTHGTRATRRSTLPTSAAGGDGVKSPPKRFDWGGRTIASTAGVAEFTVLPGR